MSRHNRLRKNVAKPPEPMTPFMEAISSSEEKERVRGEVEQYYRSHLGLLAKGLDKPECEVTEGDIRIATDATVQDNMEGWRIARNNRYQVAVRKADVGENWPEMWHLSIKRIDRGVIHDWRELQEIKNMLVGPEHEAVEIYPAESRLVDSANQYHLWVMCDPDIRFPFGFNARVVDEKSIGRSKNRPFANGVKK